MQPIARVNPTYFAAMHLFIAVRDVRDVRYYLESIFIEPHPEQGVVLVATDGATLALIHDPDGWVKEPIIVGKIGKGLVAACASRGSVKRMNVPTHLYITQNGAVLESEEQAQTEIDPFSATSLHMSKIEIVDAKYPDYRRVIDMKREDVAGRPVINTIYLNRIDAAARILLPYDKYRQGVKLFPSGKEAW